MTSTARMGPPLAHVFAQEFAHDRHPAVAAYSTIRLVPRIGEQFPPLRPGEGAVNRLRLGPVNVLVVVPVHQEGRAADGGRILDGVQADGVEPVLDAAPA